MNNKIEFNKYITILCEVFDRELSKGAIQAYWISLEQYSDADCIKAFNRAVTECKFFPKPAELIEFINPKRDSDAQAQLAWIEVDKAVKAHGPYASVQFSDPAIMSTIDAMGGWINIQDCTMEDWKWKRIEFIKLYPTIKARGNHDIKHLPGQCEIENNARGYNAHIKDPELIGQGRHVKLLGSKS